MTSRNFFAAAAFVAANPFPTNPELLSGLVDLDNAIDNALNGPDTSVRLVELQRLYPCIPNRRWVYRHQTKLGAQKVEGKRSLRFSLRTAQKILGPPAACMELV